MPKPVESFVYIKYHISSRHRPIKRPKNSIIFNCHRICSWKRKTETILEIRKKPHFWEVLNSNIIYKFLKDFANCRKKTNKAEVFSRRPQMTPSKNLKNKISWDIYWKGQLVRIKFRFTALQSQQWNTIRTRSFWRINIGYELLLQSGRYSHNMQSEVSSKEE